MTNHSSDVHSAPAYSDLFSGDINDATSKIPDVSMSSPSRALFRIPIIGIALFICFSMSVSIVALSIDLAQRDSVSESQKRMFLHRCNAVVEAYQGRAKEMEIFLTSAVSMVGRGLQQKNKTMYQDDWEDFVARFSVQETFGVLGAGFISADDTFEGAKAREAAIVAMDGVRTISPADSEPLNVTFALKYINEHPLVLPMFTITSIAPLATNAAAYGLVVSSESSRLQSCLIAAATRQTAQTAPIRLVQANNSWGFLLLHPYYDYYGAPLLKRESVTEDSVKQPPKANLEREGEAHDEITYHDELSGFLEREGEAHDEITYHDELSGFTYAPVVGYEMYNTSSRTSAEAYLQYKVIDVETNIILYDNLRSFNPDLVESIRISSFQRNLSFEFAAPATFTKMRTVSASVLTLLGIFSSAVSVLLSLSFVYTMLGIRRLSHSIVRAAALRIETPRLGIGSTYLMELSDILSSYDFLMRILVYYSRFLPNSLRSSVGRSLERGVKGQLITVMIADLLNFTSICEDYGESLAQLAHALSYFLETVNPIITAHDGCIDKYIGDAVMSLWNAPRKVSAPERHATVCAFALQEATNDVQIVWDQCVPGSYCQLGIGISSGFAMVGIIGGRDLWSYTALGHTVNVAARVEAVTRSLRANILITEAVHEKVRDVCVTRSVGRYRLRGIALPMPLFEAVGMSSAVELFLSGIPAYKGLTMTPEQALNSQRLSEAMQALYRLEFETASHILHGIVADDQNDRVALILLQSVQIIRSTPDWAGEIIFARDIPVRPKLLEQSASFDLARIEDFCFDFYGWGGYCERSLISVVHTAFVNHGLFTSTNINPSLLAVCVRDIESRYHENPFHSAAHACDITQTVHYFLNEYKKTHAVAPVDCAALLLATACHDVDHPGFNNRFAIVSGHALASRYNDRSVLEAHAAAVSWSIFSSGCPSFLGNSFSPAEVSRFRRVFLAALFATDMTFHPQVLSAVAKKDSDVIDDLSLILHAADISNPVKPFAQYMDWLHRCHAEFWAQGDKEIALEVDVSPLCARKPQDVPKDQRWFMDFIIKPTMETLCSVLGIGFETSVMYPHFVTNRSYWDGDERQLVTEFEIKHLAYDFPKTQQLTLEKRFVMPTDIHARTLFFGIDLPAHLKKAFLRDGGRDVNDGNVS